MIVDPIIVLYALDQGLTPSQIFLIFSLETLFLVLLEIPTGIVSDVNGHKYSILLATLSFCLSQLTLIFFPVFSGFVFYALFTAFFKSFLSGADNAYIFIALKRQNREKEFSMIRGKLSAINLYLTAIVTFFVGFIYVWNPKAPFWLGLTSGVISFFILTQLDNLKENEDNHKPKKEVDQASSHRHIIFHQYSHNLKIAINEIKEKKSIQELFIYSSFISFFLVGLLGTYQIYLEDISVPSQYFGVIYCILYLFSAIASQKASVIKNAIGTSLLLWLFPVLIMFTAALMATSHVAFIVALLLPRLVIGVYPILISDLLNQVITSSRATILSIRSLIMRIFHIAMLPLIGYGIELFSLSTTLWIMTSFIIWFSLFSQFSKSFLRNFRSR